MATSRLQINLVGTDTEGTDIDQSLSGFDDFFCDMCFGSNADDIYTLAKLKKNLTFFWIPQKKNYYHYQI